MGIVVMLAPEGPKPAKKSTLAFKGGEKTQAPFCCGKLSFILF
jgi:hypothetical protein